MSEVTSNFPIEAIGIIDDVLEVGREKGYMRGGWRAMCTEAHLHKAISHLSKYYDEDVDQSDEDHLAHALTRLAMAVSVREQKEDCCD